MLKSTILLLVVWSAALASAQPAAMAPATRPKDTPEVAEARAALSKFWETVAAGDTAKAKAMTDPANPETEKIVEMFAAASKAGKRLTEACTAKFGDQGGRMRGGDFDASTLAKRVSMQTITVNGDIASVQGEGELHKIGGEWKFASFSKDPRAAKIMSTLLPVVTRAMEEAAADVDAGKHADFASVQKAMNDKTQPAMRAAIADLMGGTTRPSTRPATRPAR